MASEGGERDRDWGPSSSWSVAEGCPGWTSRSRPARSEVDGPLMPSRQTVLKRKMIDGACCRQVDQRQAARVIARTRSSSAWRATDRQEATLTAGRREVRQTAWWMAESSWRTRATRQTGTRSPSACADARLRSADESVALEVSGCPRYPCCAAPPRQRMRVHRPSVSPSCASQMRLREEQLFGSRARSEARTQMAVGP